MSKHASSTSYRENKGQEGSHSSSSVYLHFSPEREEKEKQRDKVEPCNNTNNQGKTKPERKANDDDMVQ